MKLDLSPKSLPKVHIRNGKKCFFCQVRKILIVITEEEKVRQALIAKMVKDLQFPIDYFDVEVPLSHFKKGQKGRADIIVYENATKFFKDRKVLMLIECKMPDEIIDLYIHENQINKYNETLDAEIQVIANGKHVRLKERNGTAFQDVTMLPTYESILKRKKIKYQPPVPLFLKETLQYENNGKKEVAEYIETFYGHYMIDLPYEVITNKQWLTKYYKQVSKAGYPIGKKTPKELYPYIFRVMDVFYSLNIKIKNLKIKNLKFIEDVGWRMDKFSYPTGTLLGFYRYFMIKDYRGDLQIISFAVYSTYGRTYIMVGLDDYEKKSHSLELCLDTNLWIDEKTPDFLVTHDGRLTIGSSSVKKSAVISYVKKRAPYMVKDDLIHLGLFNLKDKVNRENSDMVLEFYGRLIEYSFLRNEFRKEWKDEHRM